jgi:predicted DNA-binding transcriptional regulator AlpA
MTRGTTVDLTHDPLLTREQAAKLLAIEPHTLACWRSEGRGPSAIKFGSGRSAAVRYRRSEIERWLADPAAVEAASREPWREERRRAVAKRATPAEGGRRRKARRRVRAR